MMTTLSDSPNDESREIVLLIEKFGELSDHVGKYIYPKFNAPEMHPCNTQSWPKILSGLYNFSNPYRYFKLIFSGRLVLFSTLVSFWFIMFTGLIPWVIGGFEYIFGTSQNSSTMGIVPWYAYLYFVLSILSIFAGIVINIHGILFIFNSENSWKLRTIWGALLFALFVYLYFEFQTDYPKTFPYVLSNERKMFAFILLFVLAVLPFSIFSVTFILQSSLFLIWLIFFLLEYLNASNNPNTYFEVKKIISETVIGSMNQWKLLDLSSAELTSIREMAKDNLEATEKRLVPTFWFLTILGLIANTKYFEKWVDGWVTYFSGIHFVLVKSNSSFTLPSEVLIIFILVFGIVYTIAVLVVSIYIKMFRNIPIQSALIDACTVSLFAVEQKEKKLGQRNIPEIISEKNKSFWQRLFQ